METSARIGCSLGRNDAPAPTVHRAGEARGAFGSAAACGEIGLAAALSNTRPW